MTMIEKVCRALCMADRLDPDADWRSNGVVMLDVAIPLGQTQRWRLYEDKARAAIEAMREPTPEMERAGDIDGPVDVTWRVMVDAALKS